MPKTQSQQDSITEVLQYTGGRIVQDGGYLWEFCPVHPKCNKWGYVQQHRLVFERHHGRFLRKWEIVHHLDGDKLNNDPNNLVAIDKKTHMAIHQKIRHDTQYPPLTRDVVKDALARGGLKAAAKELGCHQKTIRYNFPDLVAPYKRKSPAILDDPKWVSQLETLAADPQIGYREAAKILGISAESIGYILERNGIVWVRKSKTGEVHTKYVRKGQEYLDDPELVEAVRRYAADDKCTLAQASELLHMPASQIRRVAIRNKIEWVRCPYRSYPVEQ